jgi:hypothetical protein
MADLESVIEDSLTDAELPQEPTTDEQVDQEALPEAPEASPESPEGTPEATEATSKGDDSKSPQDEFEKRVGFSQFTSSGRENRIPYSRVKKITEKAISDARKEWETTSTPKFSDLETKLKDYEPKLKDYESRLQQVQEFERIMVSDPERFLGMLSKIPAYQGIFDRLTQPEVAQSTVPVSDDMPQPDYKFPDGTVGYSMEGIRALQEWNRAQAKKDALAEIEKSYGPLRKSYEEYQRVQSIVPQVQAQIAEARKWNLFNESEPEIVEALKNNPSWSLERAYQHVVLPKLQTQAQVSRDQIRAEVLSELKKAPKATSVTTGATRPKPAGAGPRSLEQVIADAAGITLRPTD